MKRILVTGAAGFIGFHIARRLLAEGNEVVGIDNLSPYYDVRLKEERLKQLAPFGNFRFHRADIADRAAMERLFARERPRIVVHMAAQAGVRYSVENPHAYVDSNLVGFMNVLEGCRQSGVEHLVFASSSSVYGANTRTPFSVHHNVDHPVSLYAATKKANELMAHTYAALYGISCTGLRLFTVYGPWGRPDMAPYLFTRAILEDRPIEDLQRGPHEARFHLYRRHRQGGGLRDTEDTGGRRSLGRRRPGPCDELCPVQDLQYRQRQAGRSDGIHRRAGEAPRPKSPRKLLPMQPGDVAGNLCGRRVI